MNSSPHIDELAELYALGSLADAERELVDAHARSCESCAARLGEAEATVAALIEPQAPRASLDRRIRGAFGARSRSWSAAPLIAAAFVLGLLPSILLWNSVTRNAAFDADRTQAVQAMVNSHFQHAPFVPLVASAPKAKMIYGRTGWGYIVAQTNHAYGVAAQENGRLIPLGDLHVRGNAGELFIAHVPNANRFILLDGTRSVASVTLPRRR